MILLYVPCSSEKEALKIASAALNARLAACANYWNGKSAFNWKNKQVNTKECFLLLKTTPRKRLALERLIKQMHSYELPAIIGIKPYAVNKEFAFWVNKQLK